MSPPRNLIIYNHTAVSVWLSWEPPLEPNGVVIQYGFRIRDLITHTVTHRVPFISHTDSDSTITAHTHTHTQSRDPFSQNTHCHTDFSSNFTLQISLSSNIIRTHMCTYV